MKHEKDQQWFLSDVWLKIIFYAYYANSNGTFKLKRYAKINHYCGAIISKAARIIEKKIQELCRQVISIEWENVKISQFSRVLSWILV